jgi:hypothetical protein
MRKANRATLGREIVIEAGVPGWMADARSMREEMPSIQGKMRCDIL